MSNTTAPRYLRTVSLTILLVVPGARAQPAAPAKLDVVMVEGDGAIKNIRQRTARETIVQVEDEYQRPVAGGAAAVGAVVATRGASNGSTSTPSPIGTVITPGTPSVGRP